MWLQIASKLVPGIIKTGMSIASNRRRAKEFESVAEMRHAEKMANGEVEYQKAVMQNNQQGWKDEFVLILVSAPVMLLIWSIFDYRRSYYKFGNATRSTYITFWSLCSF